MPQDHPGVPAADAPDDLPQEPPSAAAPGKEEGYPKPKQDGQGQNAGRVGQGKGSAGGQAGATPTPDADAPEGSATTNKVGDVVSAQTLITQGQNIFINVFDPTTASSMFGGPGSGGQDSSANTWAEQIRKNALHPPLTGASFVIPQDKQHTAGETSLPETNEELTRWYYGELQESERSFVQAVAVLHGAPQHEVANISRMLYAPIAQQLKEAAPRPLSPEELYKHTHTKSEVLHDATRLLWQDADDSGLSPFSLRVLRFIASTEVADWTRGSQAKDGFFKLLEKWPTTLPGEGAWRAARALGVMWKQDVYRLQEKADGWAASQKQQEWAAAAALLDGAYEFERLQMGAEAADTKKSTIIPLIEAWVTAAHGAEKVGPGCAAAYAYGLIGQRSPQIALEGLDRLLGFPQHRTDDEIRLSLSIFAAGMSSYVALATSGHARQVLVYLATVAERLVHQRVIPQETRNRQRDMLRRQVRLLGIFTAFFLLAAVSSTGTQKKQSASYSREQTLPTPMPFPDEEGRDVLLMAILANGASGFLWRKSLTHLLCAALVDGNPDAVMQVLRRWAYIVIRQRGEEQQAIYRAYVQFMVDIGRLAQVWCHDLTRPDFRPLPAVQAYKERLNLWQFGNLKGERPLADLSQAVLSQLGI